MNNATRKLVSAAAIAVLGLGVAAAASPAAAVTMYPDGSSGPDAATLGAVNPGEVNPWHGDWNHGAGYFPGQGGDLAYDMATDGGATLGSVNPGEVNPWRGAWNTESHSYGHMRHRNAAYYNRSMASGGAVEPGAVNPWRGPWNVGGDYSGYAYSGYGADVAGATYAPAGVTLGSVNPGQVNPWHGAWNTGPGQANGFWDPVDAAGAAASDVAGAVTAPVTGAYNCAHFEATYDRYGNYIGQRWVNAC